MIDGKSHGAGQKAKLMGAIMGEFRFLKVVSGRYDHPGVQHHLSEPASAVRRLHHGSHRGVFVSEDTNASFCTEVKHPKHVTRGECIHQELFRIVARGIPTKGRIRGTENPVSFFETTNLVVSTVDRVAGRTLTEVAGPNHFPLIPVDLVTHALKRA